MTIFNSNPINRDPMPWKCGKVRVNKQGQLNGTVTGYIQGAWPEEYMPRPEFDNNPNPLLVAFRDTLKHNNCGTAENAKMFQWLIDVGSRTHDTTGDHVLHAQKVLERLARLSGGEA